MQVSTESEGNLWVLERDMSLFRMKAGTVENILAMTGQGKGLRQWPPVAMAE